MNRPFVRHDVELVSLTGELLDSGFIAEDDPGFAVAEKVRKQGVMSPSDRSGKPTGGRSIPCSRGTAIRVIPTGQKRDTTGYPSASSSHSWLWFFGTVARAPLPHVGRGTLQPSDPVNTPWIPPTQ